MQTATSRLGNTMEISKLKDKIPVLLPRVARIARAYGHPYKNGLMVAKNWIALAIKQLFGYKSDEKTVDGIWENGIAARLGYKRKPNSSLLSKARKYAERGALEIVYNELAEEKCSGRLLRLVGQDSTDIPTFFTRKDRDARLGHRSQKRREQQLNEMIGGNKTEKRLFLGYKLHLVDDCEIGLPLTARVEAANVHDSQPFYQLFPHVTENFAVQHEAKFLADSAYDAATIRQRVRDAGMRDVIAVNGRGHYCSETPKDDDYGSRWLVEQTNSVLEMSYNLTSHRMRGILRITVHAFACFIANFIEHFMD